MSAVSGQRSPHGLNHVRRWGGVVWGPPTPSRLGPAVAEPILHALLARFLARLKKLKSFCWRLLPCVSGAEEWGARGAGAPPVGRGAPVFLGSGDPFQPVLLN